MNQAELDRLQASLIWAHRVCEDEDREHQKNIRAECQRLRLAQIWRGCTQPWED